MRLEALFALFHYSNVMKPGVTVLKGGTEFIVHSTANRIWLLLFDSPDAEAPAQTIEITERAGNLRRIFIAGAGAGTLYLYKTDAVPEQWLLDPYARAVHFSRGWGERAGIAPIHGGRIRTGKHFPKSVVVDSSFNWRGERRPDTPLAKTIIYEAHLRGFTKNSADPVRGGTYLDFIVKIPYLKELGITAVEFLPVFEFNELEYMFEKGPRAPLLNFWGYSTLGFFAPNSRYASSREPGAAVTEFKTLVKALHRAGIEVFLDVVYNHTAENGFNGPVYSFRNLDEQAYYIIDSAGNYSNWTGTGNTFNCNHPVATQLIVDSLKYWVTEMHVDGFRFDLASIFCRDETGGMLDSPPVIQAIENEPALKNVKLIAEAWDAAGAYQVGSFPGRRFSEWNGRYRDDVRRFWNGNDAVGVLATRLAGSSDLYQPAGNSPLKSINFITAHDGFTLADLVSYSGKHNEANGEGNRDGENNNDSYNFGVEGPANNAGINARRLKQQKNMLASLFLARGVPMLVAGDEFGRTQRGNNNAYCQDNEISWIDWSLAKKNRELLDFTKQLIALRKKYAVLRAGKFYTDRSLKWIAPDGHSIYWDTDRIVGMIAGGKNKLCIIVNNTDLEPRFKLPAGRWKLLLSTEPSAAAPAEQNFTAPLYSVTVLERK
ncbi:MAG: glycogen debranching protein GlgX [Kiritimatiellales bacterium]